MKALTKSRENGTNLPNLSSWIEDWFGSDMPGLYSGLNRGISMPAVNIQETADNYTVEVAAPGLTKSDFNIHLDNRLLTISSQQKHDSSDKENGKFTRREFRYSSFTRTFTLPETILEDKIDAKYKDGILQLILPKKEEARLKPAREIKIS